MMNPQTVPTPVFNKQYKQAFQEVFMPEGFTNHRNSFYRLCDDVLQIFNMRICEGEVDFIYNIFPLSMGVDKLFIEIYSTAYYRKKTGYWWQKQELLASGFHEPLELVAEHILPLFRESTNSIGAYHSYLRLLYRLYGGHMINTRRDWLILFALQAQDYSLAVEQLDSELDIYLNNSESPLDANHWLVKRLQNDLHHAEAGDMAFFEPMLNSGRKKTLDFLTSIKSPKRKNNSNEMNW